MTYTSAPPGYRRGADSGWPLTPAVTSSTDRRQLTEIFSPVNASFAALLGQPGQIRYATFA